VPLPKLCFLTRSMSRPASHSVVERDELCAWVGCWSLCCLLVASVADVVVFCPSVPAGLARVSAAVLVSLARVVPRAPSPAQVGGP